MVNITKDTEEYIKKVNSFYKAPKCKKISAYNLYCKENRAGKEGSLGEIMRALGQDWKSMSEDDKKVWNDKADKENKRLVEEWGDGPVQNPLTVELAELLKKTILTWKKEVKKRPDQQEEPEPVQEPAQEPAQEHVQEKKVKKTQKKN